MSMALMDITPKSHFCLHTASGLQVEMAQRLRALTAFPEDGSLVPRTMELAAACSSSVIGSNTLF
ncbi:rCG63551 [Rattus norvegicus]|uniref:RCG63551 n=1 Tax=Rattus norvegicus TaxID=10116 RepID=A6JC58_RAT|nr:rCG63551 [Rattus norvegicus]